MVGVFERRTRKSRIVSMPIQGSGSTIIMDRLHGEVSNYKYWQTLKCVRTKESEARPTKQAIEFERYLQSLESENRQFEMGLAMRKASLEKTKDEQCSLDAIKNCAIKGTNQTVRYWYLNKDSTSLELDTGRVSHESAVITHMPLYKPEIEAAERRKHRVEFKRTQSQLGDMIEASPSRNLYSLPPSAISRKLPSGNNSRAKSGS